MPLHVKRLIIVFAAFILLSILIRYLLIPESFGEYGHYRAASLKENSEKELRYAGEEYCIECHDDIGNLKNEGPHGNVKCEVCHGPGYKHVEEPEVTNIITPDGREFCGKCHSLNAAKKSINVIQIDLADHNIESDCIECHNPHEPWHEMN